MSLMVECSISYHRSKNKERLRRIGSPSAPRYRNLHLDLLWLHASCRSDRPTTPTLPPAFGHSLRSASLPQQSRSYFFRFLPRDVPRSLPLPPLLGCALQPHSRSRLLFRALFGTIQAAMTNYH